MQRLVVILFVWVLAGGAVAQTRTEAILTTMTLEQKVAQMFVVTYNGAPPNEAVRQLLAQWQAGAVVLLPSNLGNPRQITQTTNTLQETVIAAGGQPLLIAVDQEMGIIAHLKDGFTEYPVPSLLTATQDEDLAQRVGRALAQEMRAVGINMNLAPVADLDTNPRNPIINRRAFGGIPEFVMPIVRAFSQGLQAGGVLATLKHFPGHGDTAQDSHVTLPILPFNLDDLQARELVPFMGALDVAGAVMVAHIAFPALDDAQTPASLSQRIVTGILREGLAYDGLILPDAMDMDAIDTVYSPSQAALRAIHAGHDFILLGAHISPNAQSTAMQTVVDAVRAGDVPLARIEASVRRILRAKEALGVLDWQPLDPATAEARVNTTEHQALIPELFEKGVALAWDDAGIFPLAGDVLVVYAASRPSLWRACADVVQNTARLQPLGVSLNPSDEEVAWARTASRTADRVLVFTLNALDSPAQQRLIAALPPEKTLVVALQSPYDAGVVGGVGAFMLAYSPMLAGNAPICQTALGASPAQGRVVVELGR